MRVSMVIEKKWRNRRALCQAKKLFAINDFRISMRPQIRRRYVCPNRHVPLQCVLGILGQFIGCPWIDYTPCIASRSFEVWSFRLSTTA